MKLTRIEHYYDDTKWIVRIRTPTDELIELSVWDTESHAAFIATTLDRQLVQMQKAMQFPWEQMAQVLHEELTSVFTTSPVVSSNGFEEDESLGSNRTS